MRSLSSPVSRLAAKRSQRLNPSVRRDLEACEVLRGVAIESTGDEAEETRSSRPGLSKQHEIISSGLREVVPDRMPAAGEYAGPDSLGDRELSWHGVEELVRQLAHTIMAATAARRPPPAGTLRDRLTFHDENC
ncbi:hypothetical protein GUJ93_ZPchr0006g45678 [Zizania palustris]|uniref:Uncharacterized protein n=1 Tax=Zizania palustris TaxID=103762 RepID=A0A8J5W3M5_ZIZPA|nr:hypothetical protein GUJ93_ZPchr0006g45678 [Zizania palustris]